MSIVSKLRRARRLSLAQWAWLTRASALLIYARLFVSKRSLRGMMAWAASSAPDQSRIGNGAATGSTASAEAAAEIAQAVATITRNLLPEGSCLPQALATCRLLRRQGIPARVVIGTNRPAASKSAFQAHAWVEATISGRTHRFGESVATPYEALVRLDRAA